MAAQFNIEFEKGSEEVFEFVCGPCYTDGDVLQAKGYCSNCQDYLCDTCLKHHLRPKPMRHHLLLDEKSMPKDKKTTSTKASDICTERCLKHPGNIIKYYCQSHDYLGCTKCFISDNHRKCEGVVCIEDATAGLYESPEYKTYEGKIGQIANGLSRTSSVQQETNENIQMYSIRAKREIQKFRSSINVFLDKMENELDQQVSQMKESQTSKWMSTSKQIEKLNNEIKTFKSTEEQTKESGQSCNSYINMKRNVQQLKQLEDSMEKIKKESKVSEYIFKPDENLQKVIKDTKALGTLTFKEGDSKAEATFSFAVENISKLKETILGPKFMVRNLPWKIMAMQRINHIADKKNKKNLGFFLQCNAESESMSWSCNATAELKVLNQIPGGEDFVRKIQHSYYSKENDWGYSHFIPFNELLDPVKGYCKDDKVTLQVHVKADAPHGARNDEEINVCSTQGESSTEAQK